MVKKRIIITTNKDFYNKLNMLSFSTEVVLKNIEERYLYRVINNINKHSKVISMEKIGDYFLLKRNGQINYNVYYRQKM